MNLQQKSKHLKEQRNRFFWDYYAEWIEIYKVGAVRKVTLDKYMMTLAQLKRLAPELKMAQLERKTYQQIINRYAENHAKQTIIDFNCHLKAAILDAVEDGVLEHNPARKVTIKQGNAQTKRGEKYLGQDEVSKLIAALHLPPDEINWDWFILLCLKTGLRFSEALGLTPNDFDFLNQKISVNKTFDYKHTHALVNATKTSSSNRNILLDRQLAAQFELLVEGLNKNKPIFVSDGRKVYNSTVVGRLKTLCQKAETTVISLHGLRHTHASILFYNGVSIHSIARRLGHADISTTQEVYLHIIKELEDRDNEKIRTVLEGF